MECCKNKYNIYTEEDGGSIVMICRVCGKKHYEIDVERLTIGIGGCNANNHKDIGEGSGRIDGAGNRKLC
jgi:hypothetical protein